MSVRRMMIFRVARMLIAAVLRIDGPSVPALEQIVKTKIAHACSFAPEPEPYAQFSDEQLLAQEAFLNSFWQLQLHRPIVPCHQRRLGD